MNQTIARQTFSIPALAELQAGADFTDNKSITGDMRLNDFIAAFLSYQPGWLRALYRLRGTEMQRLDAEAVPLTAGEMLLFFEVIAAETDYYWIGTMTDRTMTAYLAFVREPGQDGICEFQVMTLVHYHNIIGRIMFNIIRPFHHLIVQLALRAAVR